jgi:hypothetical protein
MRTASIVGIILIALGIFSLVYFVSPIRLLVDVTADQQSTSPVPAILAGLALICGIALLFAVRPRKNEKKDGP